MRIKQLSITGFGKFTDRVIDLTDACQMFYGENETGKTTIYRFIQYILFGFPRNNNNRRDYRPLNSSAFGGSMIIEINEERYRVERYKDKDKGRAVLHLPNGDVKGDKELARLLYPLNLETFQQVFSLDQVVLLDLGKVTEDNFNQQLFSLGLSGTNQLLETQKTSLLQAEEIYKPRGNKPPLNQLFVQYNKLKQVIERQKNDQIDYNKVLDNLQAVEEEIQQKEAEITELDGKFLSMNRQNAAYEATRDLKKEAEQKAARHKRDLLKHQEAIQHELYDLEEEHPSLLGPSRQKDREPSKVGLVFFIACLVLASLTITLVHAPTNFILAFIILLIGTGVAYLVGQNNKKNFYSEARRRWEELYVTLEGIEEELNELEEYYGGDIPDVEEEVVLTEEELKQMDQKIQNNRTSLQDLYYEKQEILYAKHRLEQDTTLDDLYQERESLSEEIRELLLAYATKKTKAKFIDQLLSNLSQNELPDLLEKASSLLDILTNYEYGRILMSEQGFLVENKLGQKYSVVSLSTATKDQLILAIRFAFLMIGEKRMSPVVIDDGWLHYDTKRKRQLMHLFQDFSQFNQIIVFSSDIVMKQLFEKENLPITIL